MEREREQGIQRGMDEAYLSPYPRGRRRSPAGVLAASWLTRFTESWAAMVAGSGYPLAVVLVTLV